MNSSHQFWGLAGNEENGDFASLWVGKTAPGLGAFCCFRLAGLLKGMWEDLLKLDVLLSPRQKTRHSNIKSTWEVWLSFLSPPSFLKLSENCRTKSCLHLCLYIQLWEVGGWWGEKMRKVCIKVDLPHIATCWWWQETGGNTAHTLFAGRYDQW